MARTCTPGDSFTPPSTQVEVLFVPTSAPWLRIAEVIDYLRAVVPRIAVPIHQAALSAPGHQLQYRLLENFSSHDTTVRVLEPGNTTTLSPLPGSCRLQPAGTSGLQLTGSAHGRWRRRRTERPRLILEGMTLLCSRCCQSPSRPSWSATVSPTVLQFPFQGAAGAVARPQTRRSSGNRRPGDSAGYELERAGAYEVQFIAEEMST